MSDREHYTWDGQHDHLSLHAPLRSYAYKKPTITLEDRSYSFKNSSVHKLDIPSETSNVNLTSDRRVPHRLPYASSWDQQVENARRPYLQKVPRESQPSRPEQTHPDNQNARSQRAQNTNGSQGRNHPDATELADEVSDDYSPAPTQDAIRERPPKADNVSTPSASSSVKSGLNIASSALSFAQKSGQKVISGGSKVLPTLADDQAKANNTLGTVASGISLAGSIATAFL
jgi:hypothetical protein